MGWPGKWLSRNAPGPRKDEYYYMKLRSIGLVTTEIGQSLRPITIPLNLSLGYSERRRRIGYNGPL